jgi:HrpA-like RNA helicase
MKNERNLLKLLSDEECLNASKKAFLTADLHKKSAETLAKDRYYGIPVSHLILSTEQSVVGILLYIQHLGMNVRNIAGVHMFFTDHIIKHRLATMISFMYPMLKLFMGLVQKTKEKLHNPDAQIEYSEEEEALMSKDEKRVQNIFKDLPEMLDWWDDANMQKNKGFYVDYSESLETPLEVSELEYKQAFVIVDNFQKQISETVGYFEKTTEKDKQEIKKNSKKYGIDKILLPVIETRKKEIRDKDKNPLDIMKDIMNKSKTDKHTKEK